MRFSSLMLGFVLASAGFHPSHLVADDDLTAPVGSIVTDVPEADQTPAGILYIGPGLAIYNGEFTRSLGGSILGWGVNAGFLKQFGNSGLYWGGDFGLHFWGLDPIPNVQNSSRGALSIQLLPSLVYRFSNISGNNFKPFFGVSIGPNLYVFRSTQGGSVSQNQVATTNEMHFYFELLARPGIDWEFTSAITLSAEMKVGILNWDFILLPQTNLSINL